ncbi:S8 family serine peptidase [Streptomyces amakusaensis]|uniref:S8 family serine peptidase n=1 Tax=Streptomyces amakusaensis TaxID=67271 RepID=A0ABW0ADG0_9ACTN
MLSKRHRNAGIAALTAAISLALAAGLSGVAPTTASASPGEVAVQAGSAVGGVHQVTLITGDRVTVDGKGKVVGFEPGRGRTGIPVQTYTEGGHTHVVPRDAHGLIAEGKLDRRLFDVTELGRAESRRVYGDGLRLIVEYGGGSAGPGARRAVRGGDGTEVSRSLKALNADAVTVSAKSTPELWETLTSGEDGRARAAASGISRIWLDGIRRANLETSAGRIGAPKVWQSGYEGAGVKIAVLDSGVDGEHPDLKGRVVAARNFSDSPDSEDRDGHGTHVAATAAGSGAGSNGRYRGVAPKAGIINGKVLGDDGRGGTESGIVAAVDWAVAQGADIVNLSLGGRDTPEIDPVEAQINKVTAEKGVFFAVASGNSGPNSIGSPAGADGAFAVGAVDDRDKLAGFSSTGPRVGGGAAKPDVTAPGVDITAAAPGGGHQEMSGTSMAAPHVAGAAALLKQRYPHWKAKELKSALASSAEDGGHTPHEQGAGRIAADRAITQSVTTEEISLGFGKQLWPHTDDKPVTKKVTYRNHGTKDIALDLKVNPHGPDGKPVPAGFFTLGTDRVTVPAGGTASVGLTVDTRIGGDVDGHYAAAVVASGGGQTVRTTAAVEREIEMHNITFKHIGRDGKPSKSFQSNLNSLSSDWVVRSFDSSNGDTTFRLPKGEYFLEAVAPADPTEHPPVRHDIVLQPKLVVDKARTVTVDARTTKPVKITVPDAKAKAAYGVLQVNRSSPDRKQSVGQYYPVNSFSHLYVAHLGPQVTDGSLSQSWKGNWRKNSTTEYNTASGGVVKRIATGYTRAFKASEFATVKAGLGVSAKGKRAVLSANGHLPGSLVEYRNESGARPLPDTRTMYVSTVDKAKWNFAFRQEAVKPDPDGGHKTELRLESEPKTYTAGKTHQELLNTAVFGPALDRKSGFSRYGGLLSAQVPLFSDGSGSSSKDFSFESARTVLYRDGKKISENNDPLIYGEPLAIGQEAGDFKLTTSVRRAAATARVSTRIDADWTFRAPAAPTNDEAVLPISTVRFTGARVGPDSTAPAGATQTVPLQIHGAAAKGNVKSVTAHASYDGGKTWTRLKVVKDKATLKNPARGKAVALRAKVTDKQGGTAQVTVYNAFFGK